MENIEVSTLADYFACFYAFIKALSELAAIHNAHASTSLIFWQTLKLYHTYVFILCDFLVLT